MERSGRECYELEQQVCHSMPQSLLKAAVQAISSHPFKNQLVDGLSMSILSYTIIYYSQPQLVNVSFTTQPVPLFVFPHRMARGCRSNLPTLSGAPVRQIAFSWGSHNSNVTMVYGIYNELVTVSGANLNQQTYRTGASHCRYIMDYHGISILTMVYKPTNITGGAPACSECL